MAALMNTRRELFCIGLVDGKSQSEAYRGAGFGPGTKDVSTVASILAKQPEVRARIAELIEDKTKFQQRIAGNSETGVIKSSGVVTKEWIVSELVQLVQDAKNASQFGAATQALKMLGEHIGMFGKKLPEPDQKQVTDETKAIAPAQVNKLLAKLDTVDVT